MVNSLADVVKKITEKLQQLDEKRWYYLLGVVFISIFIFDYSFLMGPQIKTLTKINPEIKILSEDIKKTGDDLLRIMEYRDQVKQLNRQVMELKQKVSMKAELPMIMEKISRLASNRGVKIDQIMPHSQQQELILENNDVKYFNFPIIIEASTHFHDFGRFINELENGDIFFTVGEMTIAGNPGTKTNAVRLVLKTIVYEENNIK